MKLAEDIKAAKRVYLAGNGGSAANAIHIANDLVSCGVRAQALTADVATLTAIANDFGYEHVFSRQLDVFGERGDLLVVLSGSGRSPNVLNALRRAKEIGIKNWGLFGAWNGLHEMAGLADNCVVFGKDMQEAEDHQLKVGHEVLRWLKAAQ